MLVILKIGPLGVHVECEYTSLKNVVIMERVSLIGVLFLLFGMPFYSVS